MKTTLERFIKQVVKDNCKANEYKEKFSEEMQDLIKERSDVVAKITLEDEEFKRYIDEAVEDSIRIMIIRERTQ